MHASVHAHAYTAQLLYKGAGIKVASDFPSAKLGWGSNEAISSMFWGKIILNLRSLQLTNYIHLFLSVCLSVYLSTYTWEAVFQMYPVANCIFKNSPEQYFWSSILLQDLNIPHWEVESIPHDPEPGKYISTVMIQWSRADSNIDYIKLLKCYRIKDTINKKQQIWKKYLKHI